MQTDKAGIDWEQQISALNPNAHRSRFGIKLVVSLVIIILLVVAVRYILTAAEANGIDVVLTIRDMIEDLL